VGTSHLWLHFAPVESTAPPLAEPQVVPVDRTLRAAVADVVGAHRAPAGDAKAQRLYHAAAVLLHATFARLTVPLARPYPERLEAVLAFIEGAPAADLSVPVLARRAGMSVAHFARWFREHTGATPADHVARSRVRRVRQRLVLTDESIDQIAADAGFANRFHMSRVFKKLVGCGPAEFRRRHVRV
jgi:transcriptional regulator GlxA family with amidase domain